MFKNLKKNLSYVFNNKIKKLIIIKNIYIYILKILIK